jgi:dienelactone hydrolase
VALARDGWQAPVHFAAGIAFYPSCPKLAGFAAPLLILIGGGDDWTPAAACQELAQHIDVEASGPKVALVTFPGATHAFDYPYPPRTNSLGHHMVYDPAATAASWRAIDAFLAEYVAPKKAD